MLIPAAPPSSSSPPATHAAPSRDAPFNAGAKRRRQAARAVQWAGTVLAALGILCVFWGAILPWANLSLWSVPLALPGLVFVWGGASVGAALLAGARLGQKRFPWTIAFLGLLPLCAGFFAPKQAGQMVRGFVLRVENTLAPTNARLAQATLSPIEPFAGVGSAQSYLGPGLAWTLWGGATLTGGGLLFAFGEKQTRTCFGCGKAWAESRASEISFCPSCGRFASTLGLHRCGKCHAPLHKGDYFCAVCGTAPQ